MNNGTLGERITIRLTPELRDWIVLASKSYGIKPAEFCRQLLFRTKSSYEMAVSMSNEALQRQIKAAEEQLMKGEVEDGSDRTTDRNDLI